MPAHPLSLRSAASRLTPLLLLGCTLVAAMAQVAGAQEYSLFDRFSISVGGSQNFLDTTVRLDSKELGTGTEIDFESDLALDANRLIPDVNVLWRVARRHNLSFFWSDIDRTSAAEVTRELRFGDLIVPVEGEAQVRLDVTTYLASYTYYPLLRDRLALGAGGGLRILDLSAFVALRVLPGQAPPRIVAEEAETTGPLPFVGMELRYALGPRWRFASYLGVFDITVGDVSGSQGLLTAEIENLTGRHFSWGLSASYSVVDVSDEGEDFLGAAGLDVGYLRLFVKARL